MPYDQYNVVECDGHIVEAVNEVAKFMDPATRKHELEPARNREGVFPSLDGFHLALHTGAAERERVTASNHRPGTADDWLAFLLDRMERDENYFNAADQPEKRPIEYLQGGRILIGCEGSEVSLAYVTSRVGVEPFAYASDYPHEVDLLDGIREIEEIAERDDLNESEKAAVLGGNAVRFFGL